MKTKQRPVGHVVASVLALVCLLIAAGWYLMVEKNGHNTDGLIIVVLGIIPAALAMILSPILSLLGFVLAFRLWRKECGSWLWKEIKFSVAICLLMTPVVGAFAVYCILYLFDEVLDKPIM